MFSDLSRRFENFERWEIFRECTENLRLELRHSAPVEVAISRIDGIGVRLIRNQHIGFSSTSEPSQVDRVIDAARKAAQLGSSTKIEFPSKAHYPRVKNFDPQVATMSIDELSDWMSGAIQSKSLSQVQNMTVAVDRTMTNRQILNHNGLSAEHKLTTLEVQISGSISDGFDLLRESEISCQCDINLMALIERFLNRYDRCRTMRHTRRLKSKLPVIFSDRSTLLLIQVLEGSLVGIVNSQGHRLLEELRKVQLTSTKVTLIDRGTVDWFPGSAPFDDEGIPKKELKIIDQGWLKTSIYDLHSSYLQGEQPTGHAVRQFDSLPVARFNNPYLLPGNETIDQMMADLREGLIIDQLKSIQIGSKALSDFTAEVGIGFRVNNGQLTERVRNLCISGNFFHMLGPHLIAIGDRVQRHRRGLTPAVMVKEIDICN